MGLGEPAVSLPVGAAGGESDGLDGGGDTGLAAFERELQSGDLRERGEDARHQLGALGQRLGRVEVLVGETEVAQQHRDVREGREALDAFGEAQVLDGEAAGETEGELGLVVLAVVHADQSELQ